MKSQGITSLTTSHPKVDTEPDFMEICPIVVEIFNINLMVALEKKWGHQKSAG